MKRIPRTDGNLAYLVFDYLEEKKELGGMLLLRVRVWGHPEEDQHSSFSLYRDASPCHEVPNRQR